MEVYCPACHTYLVTSGLIGRELARRVIPNVLWINGDKCTGCGTCEMVCSFRRSRSFSHSDSAIRVKEDELKCLSTPIVCLHCMDPPCIGACPVGALTKDRETGVVLIDEELCTRCKGCLEACPYGAIWFNPFTDTIVKCDLCKGTPICAEYCEPKALEWTKKHLIGERRQPVALRYSVVARR